ncbi:outer membrane protein [Candidatus Cyanaurora vandensis]|uniref:outer membrane protein n=1 Tax=Candidatus Cyanaurora vandensis TaxID=2714958 RepID=UPI00257B2F22|nr:outer membrane beta-barrel protein [Candidatus Cyanaurora vandensis]
MKAFALATAALVTLLPVWGQSYPSYPSDPLYEAQRRKYEDSLRQTRRPSPTTQPEVRIPVTEDKATLVAAIGTPVPLADDRTPVRPKGNLYLAFSGGIGNTNDLTIKSGILGPVADFTTDTTSAFSGNAAVGYSFNNGFRVEGEYSYQRADVTFITLPGEQVAYIDQEGNVYGFGGVLGATGSFSSQSFLLNTYYDFPITNQLQVYLGLGAGIANVVATNIAAPCPALFLGTIIPAGTTEPIPAAQTLCGEFTGSSVFVTSNSLVLAYQGRAGVTYNVSDNVAFNLGYRYFATSRPSFQDTMGVAFSTKGVNYNSAEFGVRFTF